MNLLSNYHRTALKKLHAEESARLASNQSWIAKEPRNSPRVDWKGHRLHKAQVKALETVLYGGTQ